MKLLPLIALTTPLVAAVAVDNIVTPIKIPASFREKKHPGRDIEERAAPCAIHTKYFRSWKEWSLSRYESKATAEGKSDKAKWPNSTIMLEKWCEAFYLIAAAKRDSGLHNPKCFIEGEAAYAHISTFEGPHGLKLHTDMHQEVVNLWRDWSKLTCDVDHRI